tara:strand:+ start:966 stop:1571 length:606 start_codon:yes stop_codon:yes gene_type:complete
MIDTIFFGKMICKYKINKKHIGDINKKYEEAKNNLDKYGHRLAGRINSELDMTKIIQDTKAWVKITKCMQHYINRSIKFELTKRGNIHLNIEGCWINDMVEQEYNPPHTHHNGSGFSVVMFLKVPKFINDAKDPHKFKDGQLGFISECGTYTRFIEPVVGDFYIFSANHQHYVLPFKTKKPNEFRRSMSFNFMAKDKNEIS